MKRHPFLSFLAFLCWPALTTLPVNAQLNILHAWSPAAAPGTEGTPAPAAWVDSVGGLELERVGQPFFATSGSATGILFDNTGSGHDVPATDYYASDEADFNPSDPSRWGIEAIVRIDQLPATNQEFAVLELGGGSEGILLQTFGNSAWGLHRSNVAISAHSEPVRQGQRQHLAAALIDGRWELFVDGIAATGFPSTPYDPMNGIRIGAGSTGMGNNRGFHGVIETVRLFEYGETFDLAQTLLGTVNPDADNDGFDDAYERSLGFNPNDPASTPESSSSIETAVEFHFHAARNVRYSIQESTDLQQWNSIETGITGRGEAVNRLYSVSSSAKRYYRAVRE